MRPVTNYFRGKAGNEPTWVLAGKGPTFARRKDCHLDLGPVLGLNHVCLHWACALAHFTDLDAYMDCARHLRDQPTAVVLPFHPHVDNRPGRKSLTTLLTEEPDLSALAAEGRLYAYNSSQDRRRHPALPVHTVRYFSAVVGLSLLVRNGVQRVHTIGVDGGKAYAPEFDKKTLLSNGRPTFDVQFDEMRKMARKFRAVVTPIVEALPQ